MAIPVRCGDDVIAVLSRDTDYERSRVRSTLESAYTECADELCQMASEGTSMLPVPRMTLASAFMIQTRPMAAKTMLE